jgi:hypothetical protein
MSLNRFAKRGCLVLGAMLMVGCGPSGPEVATVEGLVTLDGKPLEGALVMFTPVAGGRPAAARTDEGGCYELQYTEARDGALLGEHVVSISTYQEGDVSSGIPSIPEKIPAKYNVKSELKQTVEAGDNTFNFPLDSEGEIINPYGK